MAGGASGASWPPAPPQIDPDDRPTTGVGFKTSCVITPTQCTIPFKNTLNSDLKATNLLKKQDSPEAYTSHTYCPNQSAITKKNSTIKNQITILDCGLLIMNQNG